MSMLVLQVVIKQWDKSQLSEEHTQARQQIPDRYSVTESNVSQLSEQQIVLDQHGDDVMGNRIRYQLSDDNKFIIDRFGFDLNNKAIVYFPPAETKQAPSHITSLDNGWVQCQYEWRYRVEEGGFIYWLYEQFTLNARFVESLTDDAFMDSEPEFFFSP